jgi:large subunit ribosomal protein L15
MSSSIRLHNSKPRPGARHRVKRLGCGESSGHGKTSGKGHKGQKARSGGSIRLGFEGGQMPLIRRIPKRGFNNTAFKITYAPVNLADLEVLFESGAIDEKGLREKGLVNGTWDGVKILGGGEITKKFSLKVNAISASAREKLEKAGGSIELIASKVYPARNSSKVLAKTARPAKGKAQASTPGKAPASGNA